MSRSPSVTSPMAVAMTPHLAAIASTAGRFAGVTMASMRSCDSLASTSWGSIDASRNGTRSSCARIPDRPAADVSVRAQVRPAPPRSWMPSTSFAS